MPSITDQSTIEALARAFCSNGRKQEQAMIEVGYADAYAKSYCGKMWDNTSLIAAIKRIDDKIVDEMDLSRKAQYQRLLDVYDDTSTDSVKVSALREINEMLGYHRDKAPNQEKVAEIRARMSDEELALYTELAKIRTDRLAGPKLSKETG